MSGHAGHNRGTAAFIVKGRGRYQHTITTIKGPRRVMRWGAWKGYEYRRTLGEAETALARRRGVGLTEWAIFHEGKRLP